MKAFAGIDLGGTNIKYGLADSEGKILTSKSKPAHADKGRSEILKRLEECARELLEYAFENKLNVPYVGIGSPGTVDADRGKILGVSPNIPGWGGTNISTRLEERLKTKVYVGNDANMMAWAEVLFGAAKGYRNVLCTTVGTGIGGGVIMDGKLVIGSSYSGGEFGHIPIVKDGKRCNCGLKGCLEAYAGSDNLIAIAKREIKAAGSRSKYKGSLNELTVRKILDLFKAHDPAALKAIEKQAGYMATGFASVIHLLNPEAIVVGGGIAEVCGADYIRLIQKALKQYAFEDALKGLKVLKAKLGNKAGFIGAAFQKEEI
ncbi:MAG: ROK family protein [candidate division Zixibacteria bacterium]|nr:ROK family protein [candidate division Zixibacteria bacterium]